MVVVGAVGRVGGVAAAVAVGDRDDAGLLRRGVDRGAEVGERGADLAWTTTILQSGQAAETASTSSACSPAQPTLIRGRLVPPFWSMIFRQPLAVVQAGRPN